MIPPELNVTMSLVPSSGQSGERISMSKGDPANGGVWPD